MKINLRILNYIILFVTYWFCTSIFITLDEKLNIDNVFLTMGVGFVLLNILNAFIALKLKPFLNIVVAIIIASLSLFLAIQIGHAVSSPNDPYGILTAILSNISLSIIFWEIAFQFKIKFNVS